MKAYSFAKLQARWFPKMEEIRNPYIYGSVKYVVNVSERVYSSEMQQEFSEKGIKTFHFPLSETADDMGVENILNAVAVLEQADTEGAPAVVHCIGGDNRSRVVAECFHFKKMGFHLCDKYKGFRNHLFFNVYRNHLPAMEEMEAALINEKKTDYNEERSIP